MREQNVVIMRSIKMLDNILNNHKANKTKAKNLSSYADQSICATTTGALNIQNLNKYFTDPQTLSKKMVLSDLNLHIPPRPCCWYIGPFW